MIHPDYPNLLPEIYAVTALLAGRFDLLRDDAAGRRLLRPPARRGAGGAAPGGSRPVIRQAGLALVAWPAGAYGIGGLIVGGADGLLALALAAAVPPLLRPPDRAGDFQIGAAAAFAAAAKMEGVPLAAFLVLAQWGRTPGGSGGWRSGRPCAPGLRRGGGPPLAGPYAPSSSLPDHELGSVHPSRAPKSSRPRWRPCDLRLARPPLRMMFLPPLLLFHRRARPFAAAGDAAAPRSLLRLFHLGLGGLGQIRVFVLSNSPRGSGSSSSRRAWWWPLVDAVQGDLSGTQVLLVVLVPLSILSLVGHLVAILASDRVRPS